jgi:hypothetical protein
LKIPTKYITITNMNTKLKFIKGITIGEIWKDIPDCNGTYQASTLGRIRNKDYTDSMGRFCSSKIIAQNPAGIGYLRVNLLRARTSGEYVHRIMYKTFIGEIPDGMEVCHNNGDKLNNNLWNLRIDTQKGNEKDKIAHGTITYGERNGCHKLTEKEVLEIRERYANGRITMKQLANDYNVNVSAISRIINRKRWAWLP